MISLALENINEIKKAFDPKHVDTALRRAVNTAAARVATRVSREVRDRYNIKAGIVKSLLTVRPVIYGGEHARVLVYTGGRISMRHFVVRGGTEGKPVIVTIRKDRPRKLLRGAFIARGMYHDEDTPDLVFHRKGKKRLPIRKLTTLSLATMVANKDVLNAANSLAEEVVHKEFTRQMELLMSKTGAL